MEEKSIYNIDPISLVNSSVTSLQQQQETDEATVNTHISSHTVHGISGSVVGTTDNQTLTNKTIDAINNTILYNGSQLTNQNLTTNSNATFSNEIISNNISPSLTLSKIGGGNLSTTTINFDGQNGAGTGYIASIQEINNNFDGGDLVFSIASNSMTRTPVEAFRLQSGGIANNNAITNMIGLNGTVLTYKNNLADTSTAQTLTNKTISTSNNTIEVGSTNLTSIISSTNPLLTTSSPSFVTVTLTGIGTGNAGNLAALINQSVATTALPSFQSVQLYLTPSITNNYNLLVTDSTASYEVKTNSTITNQNLKTTDSPTFQALQTTNSTLGNNFFNGAYTLNYFQLATTTATLTPAYTTQALLQSEACTIEIVITGWCSAGTYQNLGFSRKFITSAYYIVGGSLTLGSSTTLYQSSGSGLASASVSFSTSGGSVVVNVTGVASQTIQWSGIINFYLNPN